MRKIALIGTHGTGKTTLAHELTAESKKIGINTEFLGEVVRNCPLPINEEQTIEASEWIIYSQYIKELEHTGRCDLLVCDRSIVDGYVYFYNKFGRLPNLERFVKDKARTYKYLIRIPVNQRFLINDGVRSIDPVFQKDIDKAFDFILEELDIPHVNYKSNEQVMGLIRGLLSHKYL
jgi:nicotinamide riboside kinase